MGKVETIIALILYLTVGFRLGAFLTYLRWDYIDISRLELNVNDYVLFAIALMPLLITLIGDEKK